MYKKNIYIVLNLFINTHAHTYVYSSEHVYYYASECALEPTYIYNFFDIYSKYLYICIAQIYFQEALWPSIYRSHCPKAPNKARRKTQSMFSWFASKKPCGHPILYIQKPLPQSPKESQKKSPKHVFLLACWPLFHNNSRTAMCMNGSPFGHSARHSK